MRMRKNRFKVAIGAGHYKKEKGVKNKKYNLVEHTEAQKVVEIANDILKGSQFIVFNFYGRLKEKVKQINKFNPDVIIECHFNAFDSKEHGTMTLYHPQSSKGKSLADNLQSKIKDYLQTTDLGIKKGYYRLDTNKPILYLLRRTIAPACIIEPLYLDNDEEAERLLYNTHTKIAFAINEGLKKYREEMNGNSTSS